MTITDPNERARRAVIRSIDNLTELVSIVVDDPTDPDPLAFQVEPDDLFDLTFSRVGISNDALIQGFIAGLKTLLPEIKVRIQQLLQNLQPSVQIGLVENVIRRELTAVAPAPSTASASRLRAAKKPAKKPAKKAGG
jgi:hypothetical protein